MRYLIFARTSGFGNIRFGSSSTMLRAKYLKQQQWKVKSREKKIIPALLQLNEVSHDMIEKTNCLGVSILQVDRIEGHPIQRHYEELRRTKTGMKELL